MINNFKTGQGIPKKARNTTIIFIWVMMGISMVAIGKLWSTLLLLTIGTAVTVYLMRIPAFEVQTADNNSIWLYDFIYWIELIPSGQYLFV